MPAALALLLVLGLPITADLLLGTLDPGEPPLPSAPPQAIVILSGDATRLPAQAGLDQGHLDQGHLDQGGLDPGPLTLERMRAGAALHRRTGLPILVTGGLLPFSNVGLAAIMTRSLEEDFRVPVRWQETRSVDTWENASLSAPILKAAGVERIYLVTNAWHMRRALLAFRQTGLEVTPASVRPLLGPDWSPTSFLPRAAAWERSYYALHEWIGLAYYMVRAGRTAAIKPSVAISKL